MIAHHTSGIFNQFTFFFITIVYVVSFLLNYLSVFDVSLVQSSDSNTVGVPSVLSYPVGTHA